MDKYTLKAIGLLVGVIGIIALIALGCATWPLFNLVLGVLVLGSLGLGVVLIIVCAIADELRHHDRR